MTTTDGGEIRVLWWLILSLFSLARCQQNLHYKRYMIRGLDRLGRKRWGLLIIKNKSEDKKQARKREDKFQKACHTIASSNQVKNCGIIFIY